MSLQEPRTSALYQQWATDAGGEERLSAAQREVLAGAVGAALIRDTAEAYLRRSKGALTNDKVQKAIATYFAATDRVLRAAQVLGLERRQKAIDLASVLAGESGEK